MLKYTDYVIYTILYSWQAKPARVTSMWYMHMHVHVVYATLLTTWDNLHNIESLVQVYS